jgi:hypothetical protein
MYVRAMRGAAALLFTGSLAACAPAIVDDTARPAPPVTTAIEVHHNMRAALSMNVFLVSPSGVTQRLGTVAPGEVVTLELTGVPFAGEHRLRAELADGRVRTSPPFVFPADAAVRWDVDQNTVRPLRDDEP